MRFSLIAVAALVGAVGYAEAFFLPSTAIRQYPRGDVSTQMSKKGGADGSELWGPTAAAIATLTLASQVSVASVLPPSQQQQQGRVKS